MCSEPPSTACGSSAGRSARATAAPRHRARVVRWVFCAACAALGVLVGCETLPPHDQAAAGRGGLPPVLERLRRAYPDLESGRFVSVADFESPGQLGLFRAVDGAGNESGRPQPALSILRARDQTGVCSLKARVERPDDRVVCDGRRSPQLALIRDWRPYGLLLMSVYGPPEGMRVEFGVQSGATTPLTWTRTLHVRPGWNLIRLDVDTIGDYVDLSDVRALWWRVPQATGPVEFYLDDLVLTDNTRDVVGPGAEPEQLRVYTRGQRIHVVVPERFELAFHNGVLVSWREAGGPNLVDPGGLGPWPVPLPDDWADQAAAPVAYDDPQLFSAWGAAVAATQRIIEATTYRVIVEGVWRFGEDGADLQAPDAGERQHAGHQWRYTIYPSGRVHVLTVTRPGPAGWPAPRVGYVLGLDARQGFRTLTTAPAEVSARASALILARREGSQRADLLWTWPPRAGFARLRELISVDERRIALLAGDLPAADVVRCAHLLRFWPADMEGLPEALPLATDYQNPVLLQPTAGDVVTEVDGDADGDGYNEAEGCYELAASGGVLRFDFDPGVYLRFEPVFRVHGTEGRRCWVYARGRVLTTVGRDREDNLLFHLPRMTSTRTAIEVHTASVAP